MPHDDRCELAGLTLDLIYQDTCVQIPSMCVSQWKEKSCNAFFFLLTKVQPNTKLKLLVPQTAKFTLEAAAEALIQMWKVMNRDPDEREQQANQILQWCLGDQEKMVEVATQKGMLEVADPSAPLSGSGVATMTNNTGARPLVRSGTEEEFDRLTQTWKQ